MAQLAEGGKGGGGGGGGPEMASVRREFPDSAYWRANVTTDADGKAQVQVTLPDNLTTWTMDARAVTADTRVGQSQDRHHRHQGPAGAAGAAALLRRRRPGRDRRRGP